MDFTFVVNGETENRKRKTVQGACERCKRRKKRCTHHVEQNQIDDSRSRSPGDNLSIKYSYDAQGASPSTVQQEAAGDRSAEAASRLRYASTPPPTTRFVGDLNPEASMIADAQSERAPIRDKNSLGIWLEMETSHDRRASLSSEQVRRTDKGHDILQSAAIRSHGSSPLTEILLPDVKSQKALLNIYFSRFHPLLPILDEDQIQKEFANGSISHTLLQAIFLVISKDSRAKPYLCLTGVSPATLSPWQFASCIYKDLKVEVSGKREHDRLCLIQTLALLSMHAERGQYGVEDSSMHLAQAIHQAQTVGLHLGISRGHRQSYDKLFWCLWCLSTLNAASNGRPRLISEDDIGLKVEDVLESCHPAFQILITLSRLLSRVIRLYQPASDPEVRGLDADFPTFEIIVQKCNGWELESSILLNLELYYHAIAILSYRTRSTDDVELEIPSTSSLRQALAAQQVTNLLRHTNLQTLLPLPTIPYAISLALSQTYRQFRRSHSAVRRAIAQEQLECYVQALDAMAEKFQSAHTMAVIGHKVLDRILRLNDTAARQAAAEANDPPESHTMEQERPGEDRSDSVSVPAGAAATYHTDAGEAGTQMYGLMDTYGDFDGLFTSDGTLQAIDTLFDNFMGLDLPNDLFNASLADDPFGLGE